jgi:arylsulfate sulfotransferase
MSCAQKVKLYFTSIRFIAQWSLITVVSVAVFGCGSSGSDPTTGSSSSSNSSSSSTSSSSSSSSTSSSSGQAVAFDYSINLDSHPDNSLMAMVNITATVPVKISVAYGIESTGAFPLQVTASGLALNHQLTLVGMRANTEYAVKVTFELANGQKQVADIRTHVTGNLPANAPEVTLMNSEANHFGGITFFGAGVGARTDPAAPAYWGVDEEGEIVWYLHDTHFARGNPIIRQHSNGNLLAVVDGGLLEFNSANEVQKTHDYSDVVGAHHDAVLLPNDHLYVLGAVTVTVNGVELIADTINEVDENGNVVWQWSTVDHLDTQRFPGALSRVVVRGALDWTHANAVFYNAADDSLLLSLRSQSWVVKIDRATGAVQWILGDDVGISANFSAKFFDLVSGSWMANQHAPMVVGGSDILLFDNRNESNGSTVNSRAVRYSLNAATLIAEQTWESIAPKYSMSLGDVDVLANGNVLVCAGGPGSNAVARIFEASDTGQGVQWEIMVNNSVYRAERMTWQDFLQSASN